MAAVANRKTIDVRYFTTQAGLDYIKSVNNQPGCDSWHQLLLQFRENGDSKGWTIAQVRGCFENSVKEIRDNWIAKETDPHLIKVQTFTMNCHDEIAKNIDKLVAIGIQKGFLCGLMPHIIDGPNGPSV